VTSVPATTSAVSVPAKTDAPRVFLFGPAVDLMVIAGGLTFVLFPLCLALSSQLTVAAFLVLLLVCNYPHYMATNYRIYRNRSQIERYKLFSVYLTGLLVLTALLGHLMAAFWVKLLYTVYFTWSPFHYSGQNYGIALMYLRRGGTEPSQRERRLLYTAFIACFLMYVAFINTDAGTATLFPFHSIGIPREIVRVAYVVLLGVAVACGGLFLSGVARRATRQTLLPVLLLMGSQFTWFAAATGVPLFSDEIGLGWLPIEALFPTIAFLHCAQYLGVTAYYAKRDEESERRTFSFARYFAILVVGGVFLWIGTTRVLSDVFSLDYATSFLIMLSIINIHHFLMDGAIWKLRDGRIARLLIAPAPADAAAAPPRPVPAMSRAGRSHNWWRIPAWIAAALLAVTLAGADMVYRMGILQANEESGRGNGRKAVSLYGSVWSVNPRASEALDGLAFWSLRMGKLSDAVDRWSRSLELNPTETAAYAHIGLGEVYLSMGRVADAIEHLEKAAELRPNEPSPYVLLSSAYEQQGQYAKANEARERASHAVASRAARRVFY
jgi:Flp pilus assembly protein TadD